MSRAYSNRSGDASSGASDHATDPGKRTRTQSLQRKPIDPSEYQRLLDGLPTIQQQFLRQQAGLHPPSGIADTTWSVLEQATGKPRAWLEGFMTWLRQQMLANSTRTDGPPPTSTTRSLGEQNADRPEFDGDVTTDALGYKEYHGTFHGSHFPDAPLKNDVKVKLNHEIEDEYLVALDQALPNAPKGMKLLMTCMTKMEGFSKGTTSYTTHNPGNIGNTDNGKRNPQDALGDGVKLQYDYLLNVAQGGDPHYPLGEQVTLKPYHSQEIADHEQKYQKSPYVPGYEFVYTGQLDQFIKIYSTGARAGNNYLNTIVSYFAQHGVTITPESKLSDIVQMQ